MGGKKTSKTENKVTATPEEKQLNALLLEQAKAGQAGNLAIQEGAQDFTTSLFGALNTGASENNVISQLLAGISPELISNISQQAVSDIAPSFQSSGLLDSGVRAAVSGQVAGDIGRSAAEFNLGNLFNLANLASGNAAQVQGQSLGTQSLLGSQLSGLRSSSQSSVTRDNPFLRSLASSAGSSIGGLAGGAVSGGAGGFGSFLSRQPTQSSILGFNTRNFT